MIKFKLIVDFDEEENYLNAMAKKGYRLEKYSTFGTYRFKKAEPQDLRYRIDYRTFKDKSKFEEYKTLFQDSGWEHVYGTRSTGSQYFLPIQGKAQTEEIFSDENSRNQRYKKLATQSLYSLALMLVFFFTTFSTNIAEQFAYLGTTLQDLGISMFLMALLASSFLIIAKIIAPILFFMLAFWYGYNYIKAQKHLNNM